MFALFCRKAVTICSTNQAQKTAVSRIPRNTEEYSVLQSICRFTVDDNATNSIAGTWNVFRKVLLDVSAFVSIRILSVLFVYHNSHVLVLGDPTVWSNVDWVPIRWIQCQLYKYFHHYLNRWWSLLHIQWRASQVHDELSIQVQTLFLCLWLKFWNEYAIIWFLITYWILVDPKCFKTTSI